MRDISGVQDAFISGVLIGLTAGIQTPHSASSLFVNGLLESLTVHLLRHYANAPEVTRGMVVAGSGICPANETPFIRNIIIADTEKAGTRNSRRSISA